MRSKACCSPADRQFGIHCIRQPQNTLHFLCLSEYLYIECVGLLLCYYDSIVLSLLKAFFMYLLKGCTQESVTSLPRTPRQLAAAGHFVSRGTRKAKRASWWYSPQHADAAGNCTAIAQHELRCCIWKGEYTLNTFFLPIKSKLENVFNFRQSNSYIL